MYVGTIDVYGTMDVYGTIDETKIKFLAVSSKFA